MNKEMIERIAMEAEQAAWAYSHSRVDLTVNTCIEYQKRIAELEQDCGRVIGWQLKTIAAQSAALAKARDALADIHPGNMTPLAEESWREALAAISQLDGAQAGEHAQPAGDADNAIYRSIARNYEWIVWRGVPEGKRPVDDGQMIEVELVCGERYIDRAGKFDFGWLGNDEPADIVRYRIVSGEEGKELRHD